MNEINFIEVKLDEEDKIKDLSSLATKIIRKHYDPILGSKQNDYMIDKFQSVKAIKKQLEDNYKYYLINNGLNIGFMAYYLKEDSLYISKFYLLEEERNKGTGKKVLAFIENKCLENNKNKISLNVNRFNYDSIKAYEAMGFKRIRIEDNDIGSGYLMEDYVYEKDIV